MLYTMRGGVRGHGLPVSYHVHRGAAFSRSAKALRKVPAYQYGVDMPNIHAPQPQSVKKFAMYAAVPVAGALAFFALPTVDNISEPGNGGNGVVIANPLPNDSSKTNPVAKSQPLQSPTEASTTADPSEIAPREPGGSLPTINQYSSRTSNQVMPTPDATPNSAPTSRVSTTAPEVGGRGSEQPVQTVTPPETVRPPAEQIVPDQQVPPPVVEEPTVPDETNQPPVDIPPEVSPIGQEVKERAHERNEVILDNQILPPYKVNDLANPAPIEKPHKAIDVINGVTGIR